jgi:ferredoxin-NADP reductase
MNDELARSYSIASSASIISHFDIHVRKIANGRMSRWFHEVAHTGVQLRVEGPKGDCMYYPGNTHEPMTLIGTGTGMAPLYAIAIDALEKGHQGAVKIYQGGISEDRLYLIDEFKKLQSDYPNVSYSRCVLNGAASSEVIVGDLKKQVLLNIGKKALDRIYLCGDASLVRDLKKEIFLSGISLSKIHADPFIGT